jgi:hypothetical protein
VLQHKHDNSYLIHIMINGQAATSWAVFDIDMPNASKKFNHIALEKFRTMIHVSIIEGMHSRINLHLFWVACWHVAQSWYIIEVTSLILTEHSMFYATVLKLQHYIVLLWSHPHDPVVKLFRFHNISVSEKQYTN